MEAVRHWVSCPVRYQKHFEQGDLDDFVEDHHLFALPGPAVPDIKSEPLDRNRQRTAPVYQVLLDVSQFRPEDVLIQVYEGWLLVKAQHGARMDEHGFVSRSFIRQYPLPETLQRAGELRAILCLDGILVVESKEGGEVAENLSVE